MSNMMLKGYLDMDTRGAEGISGQQLLTIIEGSTGVLNGWGNVAELMKRYAACLETSNALEALVND